MNHEWLTRSFVVAYCMFGFSTYLKTKVKINNLIKYIFQIYRNLYIYICGKLFLVNKSDNIVDT